MQYRKKPVIIEAIQWDGSFEGHHLANQFTGMSLEIDTVNKCCLFIPTLEGVMEVKPLDWIIKGVKGEFYPCKPDIFEMTYEEVI
jgi:hypothetical protein